jgi:siroheme decarboxylase
MVETALDPVDRAIINCLQNGFPLTDRPYLEAAQALGIDEGDLIERLSRLLADNVLTRFGPLYQIERAGGSFVLAVMKIPAVDLDRVVDIVNAQAEVAHNYLREHAWNVWFVLGASSLGQIDNVVSTIEERTGYPVYLMPKLKEYFLDLRLEA